MNLNRFSVKAAARERMRELSPQPFLVTLVFVLANLAVNWIGSKAAGTAYVLDLDVLFSGKRLTDALIFTPEYINKAGVFIESLLRLIFSLVGAGYTIYCFCASRRIEAGFGTLLDGFSIFLKIIFLNILRGVITFFLSLLLFVPGLIFSYATRQAFYLMLDHPNWSVMRCLQESRILMRGHKCEMLVLDLSFLGWAILVSFVPPVILFVRPFAEVSRAEYYNRLIGVSVLHDHGSAV